MEQENMPPLAIEIFRRHYDYLVSGKNFLIRDKDITPLIELPELEAIKNKFTSNLNSYIQKTVIIKLNGGLGTSMGMEKAKSLIHAKDGVSFLDIIANQAMQNSQKLILMDSFATYKDSKKKLDSLMPEQRDIIRHFIQHKIPKVNRLDLTPVKWPNNPVLEWCPPGHGDIYTAFITTGILDKLLNLGVDYAFISNADNLGAVMEPAIPAYMDTKKIPFVMEVSERAQEDRKGGHIAKNRNGQILLRELAQCPEKDIDSFQNIKKYCFFNTNSIWISLKDLKKEMEAHNNILGLPLIVNKKTVDPREPASTPVYQLETAMGCAISIFSGAQAVVVPRSRFRPVKTTNDLVLLRSDLYRLTKSHTIEKTIKREKLPFIDLDQKYYKRIDHLQARFPEGIPSLKKCFSLKITGDVIVPANIILKGDVAITNTQGIQKRLPENVYIEGNYII